MKMKKLILAAAIATGIISGCSTKKEPAVGIMPFPAKYELGSGTFTVSGTTAIVCKCDEEKNASKFLIEGLKEKNNIVLSEKESETNVIILSIDSAASTGDEGYKLIIGEQKVELTASAQAGLFYGVQSLLQLCTGKDQAVIKSMTIEDKPAFKWRGLMLDVARHFFTIDEVKKVIDQMAAIKMNKLHMHLVDDQGWRIEIKKYPKLTEVGGWRIADSVEVWNYSVEPAEEGKPKYGGFYTQEELKGLIEYAAQRQIEIIPEIEMPGHSTAAIFSYPELSCKGKPWKRGGEQSFEFSDPLCAGNDKVFEIFEDIITEVAALFPSKYIHVGGDECKKDPWKECPKCKARMKKENLKNVEELQSYFIKRMEKVIMSKGKKLIGWDEILEGGLAPEATVMSWRGVQGGIAAARENHDVIMTPTSFCYFDYYQGSSMTEPKAIGGFLPLSKVYSFSPVPDSLEADKHHFVMGGQANLWTEHIFNNEQFEYMIFPRLMAMAEALWTPSDKKNYEDFLLRLPERLTFLAAKGVNFRMPSPDGLGQSLLIQKDTTVSILNPMENQGAILYYTTDGIDPDQKSAVYSKPIKIEKTTCLKAKLYLGDKGSSVSQSWFFIYNQEENELNCKYFKGS